MHIHKKRPLFFLGIFLLLFSGISLAQPVNGTTTFATNTTTTIYSSSPCTVPKSTTLSGWLLTVSATVDCGMNTTASTGGDGRFQYTVGNGTLVNASFGSDDGSEFALRNLVWGVSTTSFTAKPMLFSGYKNGIAVPGATLTATTPFGTGILNETMVNFTNNPYFTDVDNIVITPVGTATCNTTLFLEEITVATPTLVCTPPTVSITGSNVLCNGGSTGSATVTASGNSSYTYTWSPSGGNGTIASGLSMGTYTCSVTNECGAIASETIQITQPSAVTTATAVTNVTCNGGSSGAAAITGLGGAGGYSYLWSTGSSLQSITGQMAGVYTATVTDANGCKASKSAVITQPSAVVTTTAVTNVACNGSSTGSATITASGGAGGYSYLWSNGPSVSTITGVLAGVYTATVTDANSCVSIKSANITQPAALVTTTAVTNVACNGGSTGSATITPSGGAGGYSYLWSNGPSVSTITGVLAGVYTATVTDANGCTVSRSANVTQPTALVTTTAVTNVACNGGSTGSATITPSGGAGGYSYLWSNGPSVSTITGVLAGVYTATVTDANGCTVSRSANVTQPTALVTTTAVTNVACNGGSTGSATITPSGGAGGYSYLWSNGPSVSTITGVLAGVYTATVTDANGCTVSRSANVTQPTALVTTTAVTNVACNGGSTGSATITPSGGAGGYSYLWSNGPSVSTITGVLAGVYTATVTDANGCTVSRSANVTQPTALVTTTAVTNVACNGSSTGSATITASGGAGSYSYLWSNGPSVSTITGVLAGVYTATVTDANNCTSIKSVSITQPSAIATATAATSILCNGGSTGSATITATGGTGAYTYTWSSGATASSINGRTAGVYTATVTDANNCKSSQSVNITQPIALSTSTAVTSVLCNGGSTGSATITATGGTGAYTYTWTSGATASSINGRTAGVYTATVTDANNCTSSQSVSITQPSAIATATAVSDALCYGSAGSVTITATGGTSPYTGVGTYTLLAGTYSYTVTDSNGCTSVPTVTVSQPSAFTANAVASSVLCHGGSATMTVTAAGGTAPYTGEGVFNVSAGTYSYTVTDNKGCTATTSISVTEPAALSANANASAILCYGATASVSITALGGTPPYLGEGTYTISAGNYTYTVTDNNGCSASASLTATEPAALASSQSFTICAGQSVVVGSSTYTTGGIFTDVLASISGCDSTVTTDLYVSALPNVSINSGAVCAGQSFTLVPAGADTYTYTYSTGSNVITPVSTDSYTVTGTDLNGCENTAISTVTVNNLPNLNTSTTNTLLCSGETATLSVTGAASYIWSTGETSTDIVVSPSATTSYTVTGTDLNGCSNQSILTQDVSICTGINTLAEAGVSVLVYPNPGKGLFTVHVSSEASFMVMNTLGKIIFQGHTTEEYTIIDLQDAANGLYILSTMVNGRNYVTKLVKQ